jgi:hypothetical protein
MSASGSIVPASAPTVRASGGWCRHRAHSVGIRVTGAAERGSTVVKNNLLVAAGALLAVAGVIWALQGFGVIGGSFMSGDSVWAIIGPLAAVAGLGLAAVGWRRMRSVG